MPISLYCSTLASTSRSGSLVQALLTKPMMIDVAGVDKGDDARARDCRRHAVRADARA